MKQSTSFAQVATNLLNVLQGYTKGIRFLLVMFLTLSVSAEVWGADVVYKTAKFSKDYNSQSVQSYSNSWSSTYNGFQVDITNANNNANGWSYIKMGSKNAASTGTITTNDKIDAAITKVSLKIDAITASKITSITLKTATSSNGTYTSVGTFTKSTGTQTVTLASPTANLFYKIEVGCAQGSSNGLIQISQVDYYKSDVVATPEYNITYTGDEHITYTGTKPETIKKEDSGFELEFSVNDGYQLDDVQVKMGGQNLVLDDDYLWEEGYLLIFPQTDITGDVEIIFKTIATCTTNPTVSAGSSSSITTTTATVSCSGGITSLGSAGCSIESYGFVYGTSTNPTISNTKVQVGTTYTTTSTAFTKELTGLTANTTYYVRPYATNGNGTAYGTEISFKTLDLVKLTTPTNLSVSNISCSNATLAWSAVAGASKYELRLTNTSTSNTTTSYPTTNSAYLTLASGTTYSWTVQAIGDGITYNNSDITEGEDFTSHYTITYDENGGSTVGDDCGTTLPSELPTTTKSHYTFIGWYMDKELNTPATAGAKLTQNTTLYAKWEEIKFTITWSINENTTNSQELQEGTTITPPADLDAATYACEDKVFVGWVGASIDGSTNEEPDFITDFGNVKENKTYYAVFATPSGDGFTLGQSGDFAIYANVEGTNYYAADFDSGTLKATEDENDATTFTLTSKGEGQYTIHDGSQYIAYGTSGTDLKSQKDEYLWVIDEASSGKGSWRITSVAYPGRAIIYRSSSYNIFKAYATSNITTDGYYDIEISGGTIYSDYVTTCCASSIIITKGAEENGTFAVTSLGKIASCDGVTVTVTPTPASHYHVKSVTATNPSTAGSAQVVDNGDGTYTITYAANSTGESTINVVFEEDTKYTVTWMVNGVPYTIGAPSTTVYADERVATLPTPPEPNAYCGDVFVGWTTENPASGNFNEAPTVYNEQLAFPPATGNQTFYAVFADYDQQ